MDEVYKLVHDAYLWRGYCAPQSDGRLRHYPHLDGITETTVIIGIDNGEIVGTVAYTDDGVNGLHVDDDYKAIVDTIRREERKLGSSWRIATKRDYRSEHGLVNALLEAVIHHWIDKRVETVLFTFNPRHEKVYARLWNLTAIGRSDGTVLGLENAPSVLMRWDIERCPAKWLNTPKRKAFQEEVLARQKTAAGRTGCRWHARGEHCS